MGLFNWAMKGVNVERRANTLVTDAPSAVSLEQADTPQYVPQETVPQAVEETAGYANSILFGEHTASPYVPQAQYNQQTNFNTAFNGQAISNRNILVITPRTNNEVSAIVEHLRTGEAVIVTLESLPVTDAQRRIDFLNGVVCAIQGTIKQLDNCKYILTPSGVGVRN